MRRANVLRLWAGKPLVTREMSKPILSTTKHYRVVVHTILPRWPTAKYVSVRTPGAILSGGTPEAILSGAAYGQAFLSVNIFSVGARQIKVCKRPNTLFQIPPTKIVLDCLPSVRYAGQILPSPYDA